MDSEESRENEVIKNAEESETEITKKFTLNLETFEQYINDLKLELRINKTQLAKTRQELISAKMKNNELEAELKSWKNKHKEMEKSFNNRNEFIKELGKKFTNSAEITSKTAMKFDDLSAENTTLKTYLADAEMKKCEYEQLLDDFKLKEECHKISYLESAKKQSMLKNMCSDLANEIKKLATDQKALSAAHKKIEQYKELLQTQQFLSTEVEELKKVESERNFYKSKYNELAKYLNEHVSPSEETNFFAKEWKNNIMQFDDRLSKQQESVIQITQSLKAERSAHMKAIERELEHEKVIETLGRKIDILEKKLELLSQKKNATVEIVQ